MSDNDNGQKFSSLSKSRFVNGLQCIKRLYLETHHRELASPPTPAQQRIFDTGHLVGEMACHQFPEGVLVEGDYREPKRALQHTQELLQNGTSVLFEPAFLFDDIFVRVDILQKNDDDTWNLIEVKSTTKTSETHIADSAVQRYVVHGSGLKVANVYLMHLNRECRYPDLDNLFVADDITQETIAIWKALHPKVYEFHSILKAPKIPDIMIGKHCQKPYECPFKDYCWQHIQEPSIFSIPRISKKKIDQLVRSDVYSVRDISDDFPLSENQQRYVSLFTHNKPQILWPAIKDLFGTLQYPLFFLDFETQMEAIPRLPGLRPYDQYPFQYSLHILDSAGTLTHKEFLHPDTSDPRPELAKQLCKDIGPSGTIIAYNDSFERRVINGLAYELQEHSLYLQSLIPRFFDLLVIFRDYYFHPDFNGSNSIKDVLPVLVPELSYKGMAVPDGSVAQITWDQLIHEQDFSKRLELSTALLEYCKLDTLAMVEIYKYLILHLP